MKNPEHRPEKRSPAETDRLMAETREQLHELFRNAYREADMEATRAAGEAERTVSPAAAQEVLAKLSEANALIQETATAAELESALTLLDTVIAIDNEPEYQQLAKVVRDHLKGMERSSSVS